MKKKWTIKTGEWSEINNQEMIKGEIQSKLKVKSNISVAPKDPSYTNQVVSRSFKQLVFMKYFAGRFNYQIQRFVYQISTIMRNFKIHSFGVGCWIR